MPRFEPGKSQLQQVERKMFKNWFRLLRQGDGLIFHLLPHQAGGDPSAAMPKSMSSHGRGGKSRAARPTWKIPAYLRQRMSGDRISRYG